MGNEITFKQPAVMNTGSAKLTGKLSGYSEMPNTAAAETFVTLPARDTTGRAGATTERPAPPTPAQIRYWQWNREQKLLVDGSRYIQTRKDVRLTSAVALDDKTLSLPYRTIHHYNTDWLTVLFLVALVIFASVRQSFSKYLNNLLHSVFNYGTSFRMFQEKNTSVMQGAYRLEIFFYLTAASFVYQIADYFGVNFLFSGFRLFLVSFLVVFFYFFVKKMLYRVIGLVIEGDLETGEFLFNLDNFNRITGLFLFPIVATIAYFPFYSAEIPVLMGTFTILVFYLLLLVRGTIILLKKQFSIFYLFLYLCTLEFLPLLLIFKLVDI